VTKYASDSAIADFAKRRAMPTGKAKVDAPLTTRLRAPMHSGGTHSAS
jgi:hypothetical protein